MYKLVVVAGKLRGSEFELQDGENILGRDSGCDIHLNVAGISSRHASVTVTGDVCYLQDLGSSNGTILNGELVRRDTVKGGDRVALPDCIIEVVHVREKKIIVKKKSLGASEEHDFIDGGTPPQALPRKVLWIFKYRLMKLIYGVNEEYEWRVLFGIILFIFIMITITATIFPVLRDSRSLLLNEVAERGAHYADEVVRINGLALRNKNIDKLDTAFLDKEKSVTGYRLYDLDGRIVRPLELMNEYINSPFYVQVKSFYEKNRYQDRTYLKSLGGSIIGVGKLINAYNPKVGRNEPVGIIALKFSPTSLQVEEALGQRAYVESLVTTILVAILFFLAIYYLTLRPLEELYFQLEEAMVGKRKALEPRWLMGELNRVRFSINTLLQRVRELSHEGDEEFTEEERDEEYVAKLGEFIKGSGVPTMVLDSEKNVSFVNILAEDLTGIRESSSQGANILEVSREKGFAATLVELCDNSANDMGNNTQGTYELGGNDYTIHVASFMGKDNFAKAYYITFIQED